MASSTSPPRVPSIASNLHVTASDISLFSRIDEEGASDGEGNPLPVKDEDLATRTIACEQGTEKGATLSQQLLEAIKLGTSNFLLAYNTRAGIAVLLRLFKLLQRRQWKAAMDPRQLLDEEHLSFRVDAVRLGLFLGWFTGGYKGLGALLPALLPRILPARQLQDGKKVEKISALVTGAVAALALTFVDAKRRRSFALYTLTRALQCGYNCAKRQQRWHFWGSDWEYGDALLFAISTAQIMYAYVMRPSTLPSEYFRFIHRTGPLKIETLELVQQMNRGLPLNIATLQKLLDQRPDNSMMIAIPSGILPCRLVHVNTDSCVVGAFFCFKRAFVKTFPLYLTLFIVPGVVIHFRRFLRAPFHSIACSTLNATRSTCFLASFTSLFLSLVCLHRRVVSQDHRFIYYLAGLFASTTILMEPKSRRSELALYTLPRALDSLAIILHDRGLCSGWKHGEVALFALSMSIIMYCYEHEKESMNPFLFKTMKRFLQTSIDKKQLYVASLEKKERRQSMSTAHPRMA